MVLSIKASMADNGYNWFPKLIVFIVVNLIKSHRFDYKVESL